MGIPHDDATRAAISASLFLHHELRTPEQKAATSQKMSDSQVERMWIPKGPRHGRQPGSRNKVDPNTPIGGTTLAKIEKASVKRILKDIVGTQPELLRDAIIQGLAAPPPRSFPYIALAASYLDGRPREADPPTEYQVDLSNMTGRELMQRALNIAQRLKDNADEKAAIVQESAERAAREARRLPIIDATVVPPEEPERELSLEELQEEIKRAEEELRIANEELRTYRR
jgi:hypothetical protein